MSNTLRSAGPPLPLPAAPCQSRLAGPYVLHVRGRLYGEVGADLRSEVQALVQRGERRIVLDLAAVSDVDAAGMGEVVRAYNMTAAAAGILRITGANASIRTVLRHVGLFDILAADI